MTSISVNVQPHCHEEAQHAINHEALHNRQMIVLVHK